MIRPARRLPSSNTGLDLNGEMRREPLDRSPPTASSTCRRLQLDQVDSRGMRTHTQVGQTGRAALFDWEGNSRMVLTLSAAMRMQVMPVSSGQRTTAEHDISTLAPR